MKSDHPLFSLFLKYYYEFLEGGELTVSGSNDYVIEETITKNRILDEDGQNIVLEESVGKFTVGETITGATSKATARVLVDDFDNGNRLFITSQQKFITGETITGSTSGATTTMVSYRANPVQNIQQLSLRMQMLIIQYTIPRQIQRLLHGKSLVNTLQMVLQNANLLKILGICILQRVHEMDTNYSSVSCLMKKAVITYPRDNMFRVSDGKWSTNKVIRVSETGTSDFNKTLSDKG